MADLWYSLNCSFVFISKIQIINNLEMHSKVAKMDNFTIEAKTQPVFFICDAYCVEYSLSMT